MIRVAAGYAGGVGVVLAGGSLANDGMILGGVGGSGLAGGDGGDGVAVYGGVLTNQGTIAGAAAVFAYRSYGASGTGVHLAAGTLINDGLVTGGLGGLGMHFGYPSPGGTGIRVAVGSLTNHGTIIGGDGGSGGVGVLFDSGGTLADAGFIFGGSGTAGTADAVYFGTGASRLILDPGASFSGAVVADASFSNVLELATSSSAGSVYGLGDTITGFSTVQFDAGAAWLIAGNDAGLAAGQTIGGFAPGDTIELTGFVATGYSFAGNGLVLSGTGGSKKTIGIQGTFTTGNFNVFSAGGNSFIEFGLPCFAAGTRINTERGDIEVQALTVGDQVSVLLGDPLASVIWIGRRVIRRTVPEQAHLVWPVRIHAGAFGRGRPRRDLLLSPDHAVYVAGVLIPVKHLINRASIEQVPMAEVTYYHVELSRHSVLLAEGLPTESYLDTGDRANFANDDGPVMLFPDFASRAWEAAGCAPLVVTGAKLDAVRKRVNAIAASMGSAWKPAVLPRIPLWSP